MTQRRLLVSILTAVLLAATPARADAPPSARAHFDAGIRLYQQGHYDEALVELTAAYDLDPRPELLYSLGQTQRKRGHCKEALEFYQRYLDTGLSRERAAAVLIQMDRCRAELDHPPPPPPVIAPPVIAPPVAAPLTSAPPPPRPKPLYKRWWLWTSVAAVAAAGVGVGLGLTLGRGSDFKGTLPDLVVR